MNKIKGIIPPLITPLSNTREVDLDGLTNLLEHVIAGGVHGLFILGTTGEGPSLDPDVRIEMIERTCDHVKGRVPVFVGAMDTSFDVALQLAEKAYDSGAQAVVLAPPCFYKITQDELVDYVDEFTARVKLPVVLYNNPGLTAINFDLDTVGRLADNPDIVAFKDSSGNSVFFSKLHATLSEFEVPLLVGPEELLAESLLLGGEGGVPGGANIRPSLYVDLFAAVDDGDTDEAKRLHSKVMRLSSVVYEGSEYGSSRIINGIKCALSHLSVCGPSVSLPLGTISQHKSEKIASFVNRASLKA